MSRRRKPRAARPRRVRCALCRGTGYRRAPSGIHTMPDVRKVLYDNIQEACDHRPRVQTSALPLDHQQRAAGEKEGE